MLPHLGNFQQKVYSPQCRGTPHHSHPTIPRVCKTQQLGYHTGWCKNVSPGVVEMAELQPKQPTPNAALESQQSSTYTPGWTARHECLQSWLHTSQRRPRSSGDCTARHLQAGPRGASNAYTVFSRTTWEQVALIIHTPSAGVVSRPTKISAGSQEICRNFNVNRCRFARCQFCHICLIYCTRHCSVHNIWRLTTTKANGAHRAASRPRLDPTAPPPHAHTPSQGS